MKETLIHGQSPVIRNTRKFIKNVLEPLGLAEYAVYFYESHYQYLKKLSFWRYRENFLYFIRGGAPDGMPIPPMYLMWLVFASIRKQRFIETGDNQFNELLLPMLKEKSIDLHQSEKLLDFACGCGRLTRHLKVLKDVEIWGVDYNAKLVKWCEKNLPFANFAVNELTPPLPFDDARFDFVIARSIFTHLDKELQVQWLTELRRVMKPGGYLFFTTMGDHYRHIFTEQEQGQYDAGELTVVHGSYSGKNRCYVWQSPAYTKRVWRENGFEIVNFKAGGIVEDAPQDSYIAKRL